MEVAHQVIRGLRRTVTVLDQTAIPRHLPTADLNADRYTPATREVQARRFVEQVDSTLRRRATFVQTDIPIQCPANGIAVRGVNTLVQSRLRPARGVEHFQDGFHLIARKRIPTLFQLLTNDLLETLMCFT